MVPAALALACLAIGLAVIALARLADLAERVRSADRARHAAERQRETAFGAWVEKREGQA